MIGQTLAHYRITAAIGAGGMGQVYRATDTKLGRDVALKVLPPEMAGNAEWLGRFQREARAVAALNHPHVVTIYSVDEADGLHFLTMELVEGASLDRLIAVGGMALPALLNIAAGLTDGLAAAHSKGIVHRDLKPANAMVTKDGRVKVLDFGLAKFGGSSEMSAVVDGPTEMQTREGVVVGTMPYMSPEQLHGQALDARTDIFSMGVMLYEMASGERPFHGHSSVDLASAILRDTPRPLTERRRELPEGLVRIIARCLEKSASDRFLSARELGEALRSVSDSSAVVDTSVDTTVRRRESAGDSRGAPADEGFRVAVLPFKSSGTNDHLTGLADGLSEEIVTGLSRFRYLSVVANSSAARLKGADGDERTLGARLGARYVVEGSIRGDSSAVRVSAQLVDVQTGAQLWSDTYRRDLQTSTTFAVQDDLSARIVATVADSYGVLVHSMREAMRQKDDRNLTAAEWQFQYFAYREQITPANHAALKSRLERVAKEVERHSDLWACLAQVYVDEYAFGFPGADGSSLARALVAARRAVELDRANQFALVALAQTHFFRQDLAAFGPAAERAMALNPLNSDALGILGLQIVHTGGFERGAGIVRRAMELNANHAGWMHFAPLWEHFHRREYEKAIECAHRVDVPGLFWPFLVMASAAGHLGRFAEAEAAVRDLLVLDPDFAAHARANIESWHYASGLVEPLLEGLRKAGLAVPAATESSGRPQRNEAPTERMDRLHSDSHSQWAGTGDGFAVAVMPFKSIGSRPELETLAAGLTEDLVTGFSRFTYLRVRSAGNDAGARYVMEGSLRHAGMKVRLSVQLVDTVSGARMWAETYERPFDPDATFELQDDLVHRIVGTCADRHGVLARSISDVVREMDPRQLGPYDALMRGFGYHHRLMETEHAAARDALERAVDLAPANADCWAMLAWVISHEYGHGFNVRPNSLERALVAARRAVDIAPSSPFAQQVFGAVSFFRKETAACLSAAERAIALNPLDTSNEAMFLIALSGDWDRGCALIRRAMEFNPHHPRWYEVTLALNEYRQANYRETVDEVVKANAPEIFWSNVALAAAHGQLGNLAAAGSALRALLVQKPDFARSGGELIDKWFDPQLTRHLMDGLRKAGLEVVDDVAASRALESTNARGSISRAVRADEGFWVAVLAFRYSGASAELSALAEGLTEEIVTGLSRFSYLRVIARGSTAKFAGDAADVRTIGRKLGARYVMEGSVRQAGASLRLAAQLVDAESGAHLWAETYSRVFAPDQIFEVQDDVASKIVSTVADMNGVLPHMMSEALRGRRPEELTPYEAVLRSFGYLERLNGDEHAEVRDGLERAVATTPAYADALAMLSNITAEEYKHGFNVRPDPLGRALDTARRAVSAAPSNHLAYHMLAQSLFFRREFAAFRVAAERAVELNPLDGCTTAFMGILIAYAGDWDRGIALTERAMQLNPRHPGWYRFAAFNNALRKKDYRGALEVALKFNMPSYYNTHVALAVAYGHLGERESAANALRELLAQKPDVAMVAREELAKWNGPEVLTEYLEGLRKAGLSIPSADGASEVLPARTSTLDQTQARTDSASTRAEEGFWVAVLPFRYSGASGELTALAEGLTEDLVTGLSRFSYLRVIARGSTAGYSSESADVRAIGKALGASYVMEGSLRQAGTRLRVAVQLVDASSGAHLWAENFERPFTPETLFELQDELVPRIVSTVADMYGVLPRSMSEALRGKLDEELTPHEAVLRAFGYMERVTPEEHARVRRILERAVTLAPDQSNAWAMLATLYWEEHAHGLNPQPDPVGRSLAAARRAVDAGPSNNLAHYALACALFFRKDFLGFRAAAERTLELNRLDGSVAGMLGNLIAYAGDWERGCAVVDAAMQLNPNHPGWFWFVRFNNAYRQNDYHAALGFALRINLPGNFYTHAVTAAAYGQLGMREAARKSVDELLAIRPDFSKAAREEFGRWNDAAFVDHIIDGLRKAGLDVAREGP